MDKILIAFLVSLCCGCGKPKPQFATDEEYKSKGWHSFARAVRNINGVKFICWRDFNWIYYSNTVNGVVFKKKARLAMELSIYQCDKCKADCSEYEKRVRVEFPFGEHYDLCVPCAREIFPKKEDDE